MKIMEINLTHIFLITANKIFPDSYLPSRDISKYVNLKNIRSIGRAETRFDNAKGFDHAIRMGNMETDKFLS